MGSNVEQVRALPRDAIMLTTRILRSVAHSVPRFDMRPCFVLNPVDE